MKPIELPDGPWSLRKRDGVQFVEDADGDSLFYQAMKRRDAKEATLANNAIKAAAEAHTMLAALREIIEAFDDPRINLGLRQANSVIRAKTVVSRIDHKNL